MPAGFARSVRLGSPFVRIVARKCSIISGMVEVGLAFVCALVAWSATAALAARCHRNPSLHAWAWTGSALAVTIALSAAFPGALLDFSEVTFRIFQIGVGLLGPLLLGWGAVEYAIGSARARFGVRLVVTTLTIVPLVILILDRLRGRYDNGYPAASDHYDVIPMTALALVHGFALIAVLTCAIVVARDLRDRPRAARHRLSVVGLAGAAVLLEVLVSRFGLDILGQLLLVGAVACVWGTLTRAVSPPRDRNHGRRRGRRSAGSRAAREDDGFDDEEDEPFDTEEDDVRRKRRGADYDDPEPAPPPRPSRLRGIITIYTLAEGHGDAFDDCADEVVEEVARHEPDTLLFACHTVPSASSQRIVYAIYRDQLAYEEHEQQPHVLEFERRRAPHVVATNVIELALSGASAADNLAGMLMPR
ncbi:hypothetical protein GCM10027294_10900 [Marinactinospora endophytica]